MSKKWMLGMLLGVTLMGATTLGAQADPYWGVNFQTGGVGVSVGNVAPICPAPVVYSAPVYTTPYISPVIVNNGYWDQAHRWHRSAEHRFEGSHRDRR
ncbi:MAG TPA: hypothetical protein VGO93_27375 [Candidatus Xenobia bacterium]|jgi:hypothetical protein